MRGAALISNISRNSASVENVLRKLSDHALCDGLEVSNYTHPRVFHNHYTFHTSTLTIFLRIFTALLRFSGLKRIIFRHFVCRGLMRCSWFIVKSLPHLEELVIGTRYFWVTPPNIIKGIVTVLSSCPNLRVLGFVFDARLGPTKPTRCRRWVCKHKYHFTPCRFSPIEPDTW